MQPSPRWFESKSSGTQGGKRVQGGSGDGWSFGICDRNVTSTSGTCNHLTQSSWPGKFRAVPAAFCSPQFRMIPSSGFLLNIKLHNSWTYDWLRHFLETKNYSVFRRGLLPENLLSGQSPQRWQKMLENSSLSSQLEIHWVLSGWFENSRDQPEITPQE